MHMDQNLDDRLVEYVKWPTKIRMQAWQDALIEHKDHRSFHVEDWPHSREVGFVCACSGEEQTWRISLIELRDRIPEVKEIYLRMRRDYQRGSTIKKSRKANIKSKALLYRYLTREQKWDLRSSRSFIVKGQDGRDYKITDGSCQNVFLLEDGEEKIMYCMVPGEDSDHKRVSIPVNDLMLAQKIMIESDINSFMKIAKRREIGSNQATGVHAQPREITITDQDIGNINEWVTRSLEMYGGGL